MGVVVTLAMVLLMVGVTLGAINIILSYKKRTKKEQEYTNATPEVEILKMQVADYFKKGEFLGW